MGSSTSTSAASASRVLLEPNHRRARASRARGDMSRMDVRPSGESPVEENEFEREPIPMSGPSMAKHARPSSDTVHASASALASGPVSDARWATTAGLPNERGPSSEPNPTSTARVQATSPTERVWAASPGRRPDLATPARPNSAELTAPLAESRNVAERRTPLADARPPLPQREQRDPPARPASSIVHIGHVEVFIAAPPTEPSRSSEPAPWIDGASRRYLRRP